MRHYTTKELVEASKKVPVLVQEALTSEMVISTIQALAAENKLHIDQVGVLAELNVQLLLGLTNPQEFSRELVGAGIPDTRAQQIIADINTKIFIPIRDKMRKEGYTQKVMAPPPPEPKAVTAPPARPSPVHVPLPNYGYVAPPLQSPRYTRVENKTDYNVAVLPPKMMTPKTAPAPASTVATTPQARVVPQMPHLAMLPVGEEEVRPTPRPISPPRPAQVTSEFPANLPGAMPPPAPPAQPRTVAPSAPVAPYASDPYREVLDGN